MEFGLYEQIINKALSSIDEESIQVEKNKIDKDAGIGIIPYQYKKAQSYYANQKGIYAKAAKIRESDLDITQKEEIIIIEAKPVEKKLIDFSY